jgi:hypothetical protein
MEGSVMLSDPEMLSYMGDIREYLRGLYESDQEKRGVRIQNAPNELTVGTQRPSGEKIY